MLSIPTDDLASPEAKKSLRALLAIAAIGACPAVMALSTWSAGRTNHLHELLRFTSAPGILLELFVVLLAILSGNGPIRHIATFRSRQLALLGGFALIAAGTAAFVAPNPGLAWFRNLLMCIHLLFGFSMYALLRSHADAAAYRLWQGIAIGMLGYLAILALFVLTVRNDPSFDWVYFGLGVQNIRQVGLYGSIGVAAALGMALAARQAEARIGWTIGATLLFALICWTGTRSSLLALFACLTAALLLYPEMRSWRSAKIVAMTVCGGMLASLLYTPPNPSFGLRRIFASMSGGNANELSSGRLEMWRGTLEAITQHPLFGYGGGQFRLTVEASLGRYNHPHDVILQMLLHWGILGTACLVLLLMPPCLRWYRLVRLDTRHFPALLVAASILAFSAIEGALYYPYSTMIAVGCLATVLASNRSREAVEESRGSDARHTASRHAQEHRQML